MTKSETPPAQAPRSSQTVVAPGFSFCVHHFAVQFRPWCETAPPAVYAVEELQSGAHAAEEEPAGAASAAEAVAAGRKAAVAMTALSTVRTLLMRFSAAHSFDGARSTANGPPRLPAGGPSGHPDTQPPLVWTCQGLDQRGSNPRHVVRPGKRERAGAVRRPGPPRVSQAERLRTAYRNELISIVSVRPGPTPIAEIGAPDISSSAFTYACAFFGRSAKVFALVMSSDQPGSIS